MTTLGERIKAYREQLGFSQAELAKKCSELDKNNSPWGQPRIANYEKDNRTPDIEDIKILSRALKVKPETLAFEQNVKFVNILKSFQYPLLSTIQAGQFTEVTHFDHIDGVEMISSQVKASERAFYLAISGDSMTPRFNDGDMVLIDPEIAPTPGKFVAAINPDGEATFKQYKQLGTLDEHGRPHFNLVPLNDSHATLSSKDHAIQIIGVAVEHRQVL